MKWQQREYSPQQMQQMQQEALERVRQMQQRSRQVLKRPSHPPSFFVEPQSDPPVPVQPAPSAEPHPTSSYHPQPQTPPLSSADSRSALAAVQRPLYRQHPDAGAALPVFVALIPKRNFPLKSVILLHRSKVAAPQNQMPIRSLIRNFCITTIPW